MAIQNSISKIRSHESLYDPSQPIHNCSESAYNSSLINQKIDKITHSFSICFFATGIFALVGALYRWGDGPLFGAPEGANLQIYYVDLLVTTPLSFLAAIGYKNKRRWGVIVGIFTAGIYIFGSAIVYASVIQNGSPYLLKLIIPPIFGIVFSIIIIKWTMKNLDNIIYWK